MKQNVKSISLILILFLILSCARTYHQQTVFSPSENLANQLQQQISIPELETAIVGIKVQSAETGEILFEHNANTLMMPASNEKIPTAAAALVNLGPDFQYETRIYSNGKIEGEILHGDLIIVGSGDPTIGYRFCESDSGCFAFQTWIDSLKSLGIKKIDGDLIGIDDAFDDEYIGYGWSVNNLSYSYSPQIGALSFNENYATVSVEADSSGEEIKFSTNPDFDYLKITSQLEFDEEETDIYFNRKLNTNEVVISGTIQPGDKRRQRMSIHNPTLYFLSGLKHELQQTGIEVTGEPVDGDFTPKKIAPQDLNFLFTFFSDSLKNVIKTLMKESQNLYAESFIKLLGYHFGEAGTFEEGEKVLKQTLQRFGLEENSYSFKDGSGLCRYNYISPSHLVKILRRMNFHPYGKIFRESLPIAGIDGTIGYRMKNTAAEGKINAKTGTISNVRCLSGYATSADGETLIFSTMFNNFLCSTQVVMDVQDQICMLLTSFSRK